MPKNAILSHPSAVIKNTSNANASGTYFRLVERTFQEFEQSHLRMLFEQTLANHDFKYNFKEYTKDVAELPYSEDGNRIYYPNVEQKNFEKIPGSLIGYWASEKLCRTFQYATVNDKASVVIGIKTGDNNKFLRLWFEVEQRKEGILKTDLESINDNGENWFPNLKGGEYRKWYGNLEYVINWERHGKNMLEHINSNGISDARIRPSNFAFYLNNGITWSRIGSGKISLRYIPKGCFFDCNSPSIFSANYSIESIMAILNSKVSISLLEILAPTLTFQIADIKKIPLPEEKVNKPIIQQNIAISKSDCDAHETSWDFQRNELLSIDEDTYMENINNEIEKHFEETGEHICIDPAAPQLDSLAWRIEQYKQKWEHKFKQLHENEEELNRQFIDIYGLQDELTPDVPLNEITILQQGEISIE